MADAAGKPLTLRELNRVVGSLSQDFLALLHRARSLKLVTDQYTDVQLAALPADGVTGFVQADGTNVKSFVTDLNQLADIAEGLATLGSAKDFRAQAKKLTGFSCLE